MISCDSHLRQPRSFFCSGNTWHSCVLIGLVLVGAECGGTRRAVPDIHLPSKAATPLDSPGEKASEPVYHLVQPGQTLWWISRKYGVPIEELTTANSLSDPNKLSVNQRILIPGIPGADWLWPVQNGRILSYFGVRRGDHRHKGLDIQGRKGQHVRAVRAGRVVSNSRMRGYGKTVIVDHGGGLSSLYAHNSEILVDPGQPVRRGQPIARVGRSGNASTYHCHLEIRRGKVPVNPLRYLTRRNPPKGIKGAQAGRVSSEC